MDLKEYRQEMDAIDEEMVSLFVKRMNVAAKIADYKKENNMPILAPAREREKLQDVAKKAGADAALVVTPYYNKPSKEGIFRHFEAVSKVGIPIVVYNIQGRTGLNIPTDLLERIAELPNIAGVKEASGNISQMMDVIAKIKSKKPDFAVLSGDDGLTLPLMAAGGDGVVSVVSNLAPALVTEMVTEGLKGNFDKVREIHYRMLPFFKAAFVD